jgi:large subunit ribosomal protein L29
MNIKSQEIRNLTSGEIQKHLDDAREELMKLRFRQATGELTDHTQIRLTRRSIARLETILNERLLIEELEGEQ